MDLLKTLRQDRQALHQIPELELSLPKTAAYLKEQLSSLSGKIIETREEASSFLVFFDGHKEKTIAFRSDMDALPITEQSGVSFASREKGCMHACGHDGHMAMLLSFARWLDENIEKLSVNVLLIFQAGEESPGGARLLLDYQDLEPFDLQAVYGIHIWPGLEKGVLFTRAGEMMSSSCEVTITITGKAVHASRYKEGIDATELAARLLLQLYAMEKKLGEKPRLLRFGLLQSGTTCNVLSDQALLYGTLRTYDAKLMEDIKKNMEDICQNLEKESGAEITISCSMGYPPLINDECLARQVLESLDVQELKQPDMASEDFAWYGSKIPACFFFLGAGDVPALHSSKFNFDESILKAGVHLYQKLVLMYG